MTTWIETKDRLPEENSGELLFTDGRRAYEGYYRDGRFRATLPPDFGREAPATWGPREVLRWRPLEGGKPGEYGKKDS